MILNNFDMNSKLLFEQHSVLVFGEKSFIKETINICKKINFKSLFISNKFDEVCNLFSKENISIVFLNVESCNLYLTKLRGLLAGKNTRYFKRILRKGMNFLKKCYKVFLKKLLVFVCV
jgi:hypothetical protein